MPTEADPRYADDFIADDVEPWCERCDGDGYLESFNDNHSDVVITLCPDCGPAPGEHDA